ncbi:hypothetical protein CLU81_0249 [Flavobacterium sp. 9]|uniref:hypothetical protein n=1 Tax=Flavobacterium sp. 9 TaxID=2035198 RepID=UPI000C1A280B|nr:hypothetical protein [Flavobacterium sp. 9]PIF29865.1 hypothetical protein CLU81_0249 [Flavobacterium sp. 9]
MGRRFTFPLMRVTLFICWVSLFVTFQSSFGSNNVIFPDTSRANFKVAFIPNSVFAVSVHNVFEHGWDMTFETKLVRFSKISFLVFFPPRKADVNTDNTISKINFSIADIGNCADKLSALRIEKYAINTISVFGYISATAHFYTPI